MIIVTFRENVTLIEVKGEISNEGTLTRVSSAKVYVDGKPKGSCAKRLLIFFAL